MTHLQVEGALEALREKHKYSLESEIWTCRRGYLFKIYAYSKVLFNDIIQVLGEEQIVIVTESFRGIACLVITYRLNE